jgi:DNA-binding beta-propeller fold protein YncE
LLAPGQQLWASRLDGGAHANDSAAAVAFSPDGSTVFATGQTDGSDYGTVAYSRASGAILWTATYDGPAGGTDGATALAVSPDGKTVFVSGFSAGVGTGADYATIAYAAATGTQLWASRYNGPHDGFDVPHGLAVSPDGSTVFVTGGIQGASTRSGDFATVAYTAASGARLWVGRYDGPGHDFDVANGLAVSPDGSRLYVTGYGAGRTTEDDYETLAYDAATGARLWTARYDDASHALDNALALALSPDGSRLFVFGRLAAPDLFPDFGTVAYDTASGHRLWSARYRGPRNLFTLASGIAVSPDGASVYATGSAFTAHHSLDYLTVRYGTTSGARLWVARFDGPAHDLDEARAVAAAPDGGSVYVTGVTNAPGTTGADYQTIAYTADTGAEQWQAPYVGPMNGGADRPSGIAVSPDGGVVAVTGESAGNGSALDYATVAYDAR